jgi:hypothetical protein
MTAAFKCKALRRLPQELAPLEFARVACVADAAAMERSWELVGLVMQDNSKDDPAPFIQLAAVTKNVMLYLRLKREVGGVVDQTPDDAERGDAETDGRERDNLPLLGSRRLVRC